MKIFLTVLLSVAPFLIQAQQNVSYTLHNDGIDGQASLHKSTSAQVRQAFPGGQYSEEMEKAGAFVKKGYYQDSNSYVLNFINDTLSSILLKKNFPATIFRDVALGKTTLSEFRKLHPEKTIVFRAHDWGNTGSYTHRNLTLIFLNEDDEVDTLKEDKMILYGIEIQAPQNPVRLTPKYEVPPMVQDFVTHFISYDVDYCATFFSGKLHKLSKKEITNKLVAERKRITSETPTFKPKKNMETDGERTYVLAYVFNRIPENIEETQTLYITTSPDGKSITDFFVDVLQVPHGKADNSLNAMTLYGKEKWKINDTIYTITKTSLVNPEMNPQVMMEVLVELKSPYADRMQSEQWAHAYGKQFAARLLEEKYLSKALLICFHHHLEFRNNLVAVIFWDESTEEYYFTQYRVSELSGK